MAGWSRCFLGGCFPYADVVNRKLFLSFFFFFYLQVQSAFFLPTRAIIAVSTYDQILFLLMKERNVLQCSEKVVLNSTTRLSRYMHCPNFYTFFFNSKKCHQIFMKSFGVFRDQKSWEFFVWIFFL